MPSLILVILLDSLKFHQRLQVLDLPNLIVIEIQFPQGLQLLQVLNALNQILTETQSLAVGEKFKNKHENGYEWQHVMSFGIQTICFGWFFFPHWVLFDFVSVWFFFFNGIFSRFIPAPEKDIFLPRRWSDSRTAAQRAYVISVHGNTQEPDWRRP